MSKRSNSRVVGVALIGSVLVLAGCSGESRLGGSYINHDDNSGAFMVQIDDVHDHDVHGTISYVGTDATGKILSTRTPLSGTIDGKGLNLTIENGMGSGMATGTVVAAGLQLTLLGNGQSLRLLFKRADAADFDKIVSDVRTKAAQARQDTATAAIESEHTKVLASIQRAVEASADRLLTNAQSMNQKSQQVESIITGYPRFTARADQLRAAAKDLRNDDTGRLDAIRWRMDANRDTVADAHSNSQTAVRDLESSNAGEVNQAKQLLGECQTDRRLTCSRLTSALAAYTTSANNLRAVVSREASAFDAQRDRF
ncbi:MAG: hypothetical protein ACJ8FS_05825 [Sphingomicrobium sp.]